MYKQSHDSTDEQQNEATADVWIDQSGIIFVALILTVATTFWQLTLRLITCFHFNSSIKSTPGQVRIWQ